MHEAPITKLKATGGPDFPRATWNYSANLIVTKPYFGHVSYTDGIDDLSEVDIYSLLLQWVGRYCQAC
jgi:hypothetical protein